MRAAAMNSSSARLASRNRRLAANNGVSPSARNRPATKVPPQIMVTAASFRYTGTSDSRERLWTRLFMRLLRKKAR
ncbi:hypothetical protein D3C76_1491060 [compost metagenome]